jgi:hypothetical protein
MAAILPFVSNKIDFDDEATRIALALLCRFDNALRNDFTDQGRLSGVLKAHASRVKRLAHDAGRFVVETTRKLRSI